MSGHNTVQPALETPQQRFERLYITSSEICRDLRVTRPSVKLARDRGLLPEPIAINGGSLYIWERNIAQPFVDAWRIILNTRRTRQQVHA